ncbi:MAG: hypothetical protein H0U59_10015 [Gemmatimonadaceae bacterium]|nr:hypothetical protein [Gemmatimonadaceae bacterium]
MGVVITSGCGLDADGATATAGQVAGVVASSMAEAGLVVGAPVAACGLLRFSLLTQKINPSARTIAVIAISHRLMRRVRLIENLHVLEMFSKLVCCVWLVVCCADVIATSDHNTQPTTDNKLLFLNAIRGKT